MAEGVNKQRYVILTEEEFEDLEKDSFWLEALTAAGVKDWKGIGFAEEYHKENYGG